MRSDQSIPLPGGGTLTLPTPDWPNLIPDLLGLFVKAIAAMVYGTVHAIFAAVWSGLMFSVPHNLTDQLGIVRVLMPSPELIGAAAASLVLALFGLRIYLRGLTGHGSFVDDLLGRTMVLFGVLGMLPWVIAHAIDLEQQLARSVAMAALADVLPEAVPADPGTVAAVLVILVLGILLFVKLVSNVVHIAVAICWSPVAFAMGLIPEFAWVTSIWMREFFGRLAGAVLALIAVAVGLAIAFTQTDLLKLLGAAGALLAAKDLVDWLARTPGSGMGGMVMPFMRFVPGGGAGVAARCKCRGIAECGSIGRRASYGSLLFVRLSRCSGGETREKHVCSGDVEHAASPTST